MSVIDEVLQAFNELYSRTQRTAQTYSAPRAPSCDPHFVWIRVFSDSHSRSKTGDAHIIRNAGRHNVTEDTLRSLVVSHYLLDTKEFMVINHTDCGLMHTTEEDLRNRVQNRTREPRPSLPRSFTPSRMSKKMSAINCRKLRTHPWVPKGEVAVRGFCL